MESTSSSLLLRLRRPGKQAAWQRFIDLYTPLLYYWACRMGLAAHDAADLVQDVFVVLVQKLPQFQYDPGKSFRSWLRTVAENRWRDALRKRAAGPDERRRRRAGRCGRPGRGRRRMGRPNIVSSWSARAIQLMRTDFEEKTWKACWALVVEGKSGTAIAAELGMTIDAVYAARSRVLRRLRQELDGLMD